MVNENIEGKRRAYVMQEVGRAALSFPKSDDITRKLVPVAMRAMTMFDQRQYAIDEWQKFFEDEMVDGTMQAIYFEMLSQAVIQGSKWCDVTHERPKSCDCQELFKVILGVVPAITPLEEPNV